MIHLSMIPMDPDQDHEQYHDSVHDFNLSQSIVVVGPERKGTRPAISMPIYYKENEPDYRN